MAQTIARAGGWLPPDLTLPALRHWVKSRQAPPARLLYGIAMGMRQARMPVIRPLHRALYAAHAAVRHVLAEAARMLWYTPLFVSRLENDAPGLYLYGGMPQLLGPLAITIGRGTRMSGQTTLIGRAGAQPKALVIGSNVDIGWQNTISVGTRVVIGDNVRLAGRCMLAGFPGHPLDPVARAAGAPDEDAQCGDIILEDDVWLATGVMVMAGVRIGRGCVVAAGSVVTRDLPPMVIAAGSPARPVRAIGAPDGQAVGQ